MSCSRSCHMLQQHTALCPRSSTCKHSRHPSSANQCKMQEGLGYSLEKYAAKAAILQCQVRRYQVKQALREGLGSHL